MSSSQIHTFIYITIFKEYFNNFFNISLPKRLIREEKIRYLTVNIRDFSDRGIVDDYPFGGGPGMLLKIDSLIRALSYSHMLYPDSYVILLSPEGEVFNQKKISKLIKNKTIIFICGHYEGIDSRIDNFIDKKISIGKYITMGGEIPSLVITESLIRAIPGAIKKESYEQESFTNYKIDHDSYTRPVEFEGIRVPEVLTKGNHKAIKEWKENNSNLKLDKKNKIIYKKKIINFRKWMLTSKK